MTRKASLWLVAVAVVFYAAQLGAHHSISAEFDTNKPVKFTGKVTKVEWMNPHIYTQVEVKEADGKTVVYRVEGGAPNALYRAGWRKDSLKVGEVVTVSGIRAKAANSTNVGQASIATADGKYYYVAPGGNRGGPEQ